MAKRNIHLICNAHLDPVWLWNREEGIAEAISTFRTAAELCEKNDTFIFNHNEVILYKWIQEYSPDLFKRIQDLVGQGRWHIMGGWYLQPDCNMPSGESFVRQVLAGRAYFKKYFNAAPTTAINFDPFGHTRGLVQVLAKSGYDSYLFGRPGEGDLALPGDDIKWVGFDGSEIMATRFRYAYNTPFGQAKKFVLQRIGLSDPKPATAMLWGVGNHGGGPSKVDLRELDKLIEENGEHVLFHSTPEEYFKEISRTKDRLPGYKESLNPWAVGCYTSQVRIKQKHRLLENELYSLEKMVSAAWVNGLVDYPAEKIKEVAESLMFSEFHDILPGTSIEPVEEAAIRELDYGLEIADRLKTKMFFALTAGQRAARKDEVPLMIYNPHPYKVEGVFECEFNLADFKSRDTFTNIELYRNGDPLPCQVERELSNHPLEWRKRVVFKAELAPSQLNRFDCRYKVLEKVPTPTLEKRDGGIHFKTQDLDVVVNTRTGLIDRYRVGGVDCVGKGAFQGIVMQDDSDSWGISRKGFKRVAGRFKLMSKRDGSAYSGLEDAVVDSVHVVEDGPVRMVVETVFAYGNSFICQHYKFPKTGTEIEVELRVNWNEKDRMLKLSVPTFKEDVEYMGQTAFGVDKLATNGDESVAQKWVAVVSGKEGMALTCIDNGVYGSDFSRNGLRLTLLRSPAYSALPIEVDQVLPQDRFSPRIDQGQRVFRFWFNAGRTEERLDHIDREALARNEKPYVLSFFPSAGGRKPRRLAELKDDVIQISAIKRSEKGGKLIVRLFEPTGKERKTVLSLPFMRKNIPLALGGFEIKTLVIDTGSGSFTETDLCEDI